MEFSQYDDANNYSLTKFESMLKTNSVLFFDSNEFESIIHHYLENGKMPLAKKAIKLGLEQHPDSTNLKLFHIEVLIFENKLVLAQERLDLLFELEPLNEEIFIQKANIFSKQDKHHEAIKLLIQALNLTDEVADIFSLIGMEYLFLDEFENAKTYFIKCLETDSEDYSALYNVIYCFDYLDQNEDAIDYLNDYLDKNPYCEVAWHQLGKQYMAVDQNKKALAAFDFAIISDDMFVGAYLEKGKVLERLGLYEHAIENYKITLAIDNPTSYALLRIGKCHEQLDENDMAVQHYYKTVEEDPLLDKGWIAITKFYCKNKDFQKGLYYINKAINIDSDNVVYWKLYATINERLNFLEEAERGYKKSLELGNYELDTWLKRGDILTQLGEYEAAIFNLTQAGEFYPKHAEIEYRLSGLYFSSNQPDEGYVHLDKALKIDHEYHFIIEELFPGVFNRESIKEIIINFKNS
ncbi:MAG: tetratricopeptide repeat protein [Flavobacteriaceae bacterium]|nr:tetratricopeptide repeat protein [Bacteroidia bacterium]MBT8288977.1 tetratricopeptide repeat protein [Bacteroidia bacterium]NNF75786.1 tetratricopeptide repeat protein [Flavobacteriaceae bacterium]NNK74019.1 tetratricopeptide repeat protein [Flavobacteriaceae bacterium]